MTFLKRVSDKITAAEVTEAPSTGHHNAAGIELSEAIDSFMHYLLQKDGDQTAASETQSYISEHKIGAETVRAYLRALKGYMDAIEPGSESEDLEDTNDADETATDDSEDDDSESDED